MASDIFDRNGAIKNRDAYNKYVRTKNGSVLKPVNGRGGDGLFVGPRTTPQVWNNAIRSVRSNPGGFLFQEYTPLSRLDNYIVDLRLISDVGPTGEVLVSNVPWGRGLPTNGDGKVNLSANGVETTVVIQPFDGNPRRDCGKYLTH